MAKAPKDQSTRLVLAGVRVGKLAGHTRAESQLDGYRATCLLERLDDDTWQATAQLHLTGESRAEKKFKPEVLKWRGSRSLTERNAKVAAEAYILKCVRGILSSMFNMRGVKISLFEPVVWEDGTNFRFR